MLCRLTIEGMVSVLTDEVDAAATESIVLLRSATRCARIADGGVGSVCILARRGDVL